MNWNEFWDSVSVAQFVVWVVGALAVVAFFVKGWPKIRAGVRLIDSLSQLPDFMVKTTETLQKQDAKIAEIHHEVNYNNGSSVKDAVDRVEIGVKGIYERLDSADSDRRELREDLENTRPSLVRKRPTPKKE